MIHETLAFEITQGDTSGIVVQIPNANKTGWQNLTSYTNFLFYLSDVNTYYGEDFDPPASEWHSTAIHNSADNVVNGGSMTVTDATVTASVKWVPSASDVLTPGEYRWQVKYTDDTGKLHHYPVDLRDGSLRVQPSLG